MTAERERATKPEDLTRLFVELGNAGDAETALHCPMVNKSSLQRMELFSR